MHQTLVNHLALSVVVATCVACSAEPGSNSLPNVEAADQGSEATVLAVPNDWVGHDLGMTPPTLRAIDAVAVASDDETMAPMDTSAPVADQVEIVDERIVTFGEDGTVYEVEIGAEELGYFAEATGQLNPTAEEAPPVEEPLVDKAWSSGVDNRTRMSNPAANSTNRRIGALSPNSSPWCTGTLFDSRLVVTAAHCLYNDAGSLVHLKFRAAQDGATKPYGEVGKQVYFSENAFTANNCHKVWQAQCVKWDWAIVVLSTVPRNSAGASPGYMNYAWNSSDAVVAGWVKQHRGYPLCGQAGSPTSCVTGAMYGHGAVTTGTFSYPVGGYNRVMTHGADLNSGHSGGPLFSTSPGANGPYVVAVQSSETAGCFAGCQLANPNYALRLSSWHADQMAYYRSLY